MPEASVDASTRQTPAETIAAIRASIVALDFPNAVHALALADRLDPGGLRAQGRQGAVRRRRAGTRALDGRSRVSRVSRSQVPRHPQHGRPGVRRGDAARRLDAQRPRGGWPGDARSRARSRRDALRPRRAGRAAAADRRDGADEPRRCRSRRDRALADTAARQALRLARLAAACGLDGVVCSAVEAPALRAGYWAPRSRW